MVRSLVTGCLLLAVLAGAPPASAQPGWWFWLRKPERHGSRKMAGDFRPIYTSYRNHSRLDEGLLHFLHFARHRHLALAHRQAAPPTPLARPRSLAL